MPPTLAPASDRPFFVLNGLISVGALSLLAYLLLVRRVGTAGLDPLFLPPVNASLNATAALLLIAGRIAIRRHAIRAHRNLMISAFVASSLFLVGYLTYHYLHGETRFLGQGWIRPVYFAILLSHVVLSAFVLPLALAAFYFAFRRRFDRHVRVTRILWPLWLYVSATGVLVFFFLRNSY